MQMKKRESLASITKFPDWYRKDFLPLSPDQLISTARQWQIKTFILLLLIVFILFSVPCVFSQYVKGELLEGDNAYFCEKCAQKRNTMKRMCIKRLPSTLVIQLKRFHYDWETNRFELAIKIITVK